MMKVVDGLMLMNGSSWSKPSLSLKQLSGDHDEPGLLEFLTSEACIHQMIRMRINKWKNERRQYLNHQSKFSFTKMLLKLQQQRNEMMEYEKYMHLNV